MEVVAYDPALKGRESPLPRVRLLPSLEELLGVSQVLSLHVPLNAHTRNMLGAAQFSAMPRGAILVNTARGEVVDEPALIAALESGQLHAAGLDTMAVEPLPAGNPLAALPNVVLTPHVGGSTPSALAGMASDAARNVLGFLQGAPVDPFACVNRQVFSSSSSTPLSGVQP
jgi:D-3-phosphoglycerate dehydrogenase